MSGNVDDASSILDTSKSERSVWLMKCPQAVARAWKEYGDAGQPLAKITVSVDPLKTNDYPADIKVVDPAAPTSANKKAEVNETSSANQRKQTQRNKSEFMMELMANGSVGAPKSYSLNMSADIVPMCVLLETSQGKVAVDGKVEHKFDMKPHNQNIQDYHRLCRERTNKFNTKTRQIQMIDSDRGGGYNPMQGMMDFSSFNSRDKKGAAATIKTQEMKRTRMDRNELENILFKLFERQSNWTMKQLITETDQPQQFIKEILTDLGNYNKRGANQGTYELKPEYKKSAEEMEVD